MASKYLPLHLAYGELYIENIYLPETGSVRWLGLLMCLGLHNTKDLSLNPQNLLKGERKELAPESCLLISLYTDRWQAGRQTDRQAGRHVRARAHAHTQSGTQADTNTHTIHICV